jgi:hypothetical protein
MSPTAFARALLLASLLWPLPSSAWGQTGPLPDPNEGAFGQTINSPEAAGEPIAPAPAAPTGAASGGGPAGGAPAASTRVAIDRPSDGASTPQRFTIMGWAVDPEGSGSGVEAVYVYLDGEAGRGHFLGAAEYGGERPDVAAQLGQPRFALSGYLLQIEVAPGEHTLYVYARRRGSGEEGIWSAPATVDVVAIADGTPTSSGRQPVLPGACARAPDGACLNRPSGPSPTCPVIDADGQCQPTPAGALPGLVGQSARPPTENVAAGPCTRYDAANRCIAHANSLASTFNLRAEGNGQMTTLAWSAVPGSATYEVLRCGGANGQNCLSVATLSGTRYQVPRTANSWYQVQARSSTGQVLASSNVAGAP